MILLIHATAPAAGFYDGYYLLDELRTYKGVYFIHRGLARHAMLRAAACQ